MLAAVARSRIIAARANSVRLLRSLPRTMTAATATVEQLQQQLQEIQQQLRQLQKQHQQQESESASLVPPQKRAKVDDDTASDSTTAAEHGVAPLKVKKLSEHARLPHRASAGAAGYDLFSARQVTVPARGKALVPTDLSITVPPGTYGRIAPRSSLSLKHHLDLGAGVLDRDYLGNVGVVVFNLSDTDYQVEVGHRIAQLIVERIYTPEVLEVAELESTERGAGGFGSTGL